MDGALWVVGEVFPFFFFFSASQTAGAAYYKNLMLEGGPEAPFTSPISYLRQSHGTEPGTERSGAAGSACGRESGPRNLCSPGNANFQFNVLGKRES